MTTPLVGRGNMRFKAERRQFAGLLMLTGFCAIIQPMANIASSVTASGPIYTDAGEVAFWQFVGSCCLFAIGLSSVLVGYVELVHDRGEISHSAILIVMTQVHKRIPIRTSLFGCAAIYSSYSLFLSSAVYSIAYPVLSTPHSLPVVCLHTLRV
jgi:hypothetical protein